MARETLHSAKILHQSTCDFTWATNKICLVFAMTGARQQITCRSPPVRFTYLAKIHYSSASVSVEAARDIRWSVSIAHTDRSSHRQPSDEIDMKC